MSSQHGTYVQGHTHPTMGSNNGSPSRKAELIPSNLPPVQIEAATRLHEAGLGSNRRSAGCGEYVLALCTHRPSSQQSWGRLIFRFFRDKGELSDEG